MARGGGSCAIIRRPGGPVKRAARHGLLTLGMTGVIPPVVKTAISLPDEVFEAADRAARRLGISRSELYARAVRAYLDELRRTDVTERLNAVYDTVPSTLDPVVAAMQARTLRRHR